MIQFTMPTDGLYDQGTRWDFSPAIEEAYVSRGVAVPVAKDPGPAADAAGPFDERRDKMVRRERVKTKD